MQTLGSMQSWPLLVWKLIDHAAVNHGTREIVTLTVEGPLHRSNWQEVRARAKKLAQALSQLGIQRGERVATLAWNTYRHLECWFGISGMAAVAHTINPRLFEEQIAYIVNHAEDRVLFLDLSFVGLVEKLAPRLNSIEHYVLLTDRAHMPHGSCIDFLCYEELVAAQNGAFAWVDLDESAPAGLCYTSGTTGNPKGVIYTHRANVLHSLAATQINAMALSAKSVALPVVNMFHANAWGIPYAAASVGAKLVLGGPHFDAATLHGLILEEDVTVTAAVPTVWLSLLQHLAKTGLGLGKLERVMVGGSAAPRSMIETFERRYGVTCTHLWGMTELSPLGTVNDLCAIGAALPPEQQLDLKCKQGRAPFGVEMTIKDDAGNVLSRDGKTFGHLMVKGPWVIERYFKDDGGNILDAEGFFDTSDIATIDPHGYMQITDRSKDVIKSGGEWISSIDLENAAVGCGGVAEAAAIGLPHPKWGERPLLIVVRKPGAHVTEADILDHLKTKVAKWWLPDAVVFVAELPHTATGKLLKSKLRKDFEDYELST
jgi:acyl-CoA synthetase (AMP-forming)/AMP-acid ligase II